MTATAVKIPRGPSYNEELLALQIKADKLPAAEREHRFHPVRQWRFDFAWPLYKVAVECDGMLHDKQGRHQTVRGMENDNEKVNAAQELGWTVLRYSRNQIKDGGAIEQISRVLARRQVAAIAGSQ